MYKLCSSPSEAVKWGLASPFLNLLQLIKNDHTIFFPPFYYCIMTSTAVLFCFKNQPFDPSKIRKNVIFLKFKSTEAYHHLKKYSNNSMRKETKRVRTIKWFWGMVESIKIMEDRSIYSNSCAVPCTVLFAFLRNRLVVGKLLENNII